MSTILGIENLYGYQHTAANFVAEHENVALWKDMGLGKTVSALTGLTHLLRRHDAARTLVIAPLRVARRVWTAEVDQWQHLNGLKVIPAVGTASQRLKALRTPADIHTLGRENTQWLESLFVSGTRQIKRFPWDTVILDESQSFKSQSSQRWKSLRRLRKLFARCIQLTGTPAPNGYADLWSQLYLLDRGARLGQTEAAYRERWFDPPDFGGYDWTIKGEWAQKEIQARIADIVLTMREEDYLQLPSVKFNPIMVPLSAKIMTKYHRLQHKYLLEMKSGKIVTAVNAGVCRGKLLQLANGAVYTSSSGEYETIHDEKLSALIETLDGLPRPVLIGYGFRHDKLRMADALTKFCGKTKTWRVLNKDADFDAFAAGQIDYAVAHPGSMGHGLNDLYKSGAEHAVWFGLTDNLEFFLQFNARLTGGHRRMGRNVVIHVILCENTQDEGTFHLVTRKDVTQEDLKRNMVELAGRVQ